MSRQFRELRERLLRASIAPRYVRRYLAELEDHLSDLIAEEEDAGKPRADAEAAALGRLGTMDELAEAMIRERRLHGWAARAPWVVCGLGPVMALGLAYGAALAILWSGWNWFLPGAETPFGRGTGFVVWYFAAGRNLYYAAPLLIGWGMGVMAIRQRLKAFWPVAAGSAALAWISATAHVQATRSPFPGMSGRVGMSFAVEDLTASSLHALTILAVILVPYAIGRAQRAFRTSD